MKKILVVMVVSLFFLTPSSVCLAVNDYGAGDVVGATGGLMSKTLAGQDTVEGLTGKVISLALSFVGIVFFILILYAGVTWMTAMGNTEATTKSKSIIEAAIIGLVLISAAYAISSFVFSKLENNGGNNGSNQPIKLCSDVPASCKATCDAGDTLVSDAVCSDKATSSCCKLKGSSPLKTSCVNTCKNSCDPATEVLQPNTNCEGQGQVCCI